MAQFTVDSPNVRYTKEHIESKYSYQTSKVILLYTHKYTDMNMKESFCLMLLSYSTGMEYFLDTHKSGYLFCARKWIS
jgi:hypothetical protein